MYVCRILNKIQSNKKRKYGIIKYICFAIRL